MLDLHLSQKRRNQDNFFSALKHLSLLAYRHETRCTGEDKREKYRRDEEEGEGSVADKEYVRSQVNGLLQTTRNHLLVRQNSVHVRHFVPILVPVPFLAAAHKNCHS